MQEGSRRALHSVKAAASRELERSVGKDRMQSHFYLQDDVWYTSTRLEKEGQVDCRDLDFCLSLMRGLFRRSFRWSL
jgi:hypothetical protein